MKVMRKIKLEALDPCGEVIGSSVEMDYKNLGYDKEPNEYIDERGIEHEPMKQVRYLLTIGDHQYIINRKGKILDTINNEDDL